MKASVSVVYLATDESFPAAGYSVDELRGAVQGMLNIPPRALAYIAGTPIGGNYALRPGDRLEFLLPCGRKGGNDEPEIKPRPERLDLFPKHSSEELVAYRDLLKSGLLLPEVVVDDQGYILDGQAGWEIAQELGIECKYRVRTFDSEIDKLEFILLRNCPRRNLTGEEKRQVIQKYLLLDPEISNKHLADLLVVSQGIVAGVREQLVSSSRIEMLPTHRGKDGRYRKAKYKNVVADSEKAVVKALGLLKHLPDVALGRTLDIVSAGKLASRNRTKAERQERVDALPPLSREQLIDEIRLFQCGFRSLRKKAKLQMGMVDMVLGDPPYDKGWMESDLKDFAKECFRLLRYGGILVTYIGKMNWLEAGIALKKAGFDLHPLLRCRYVGPINNHGGHMLSSGEPIILATKGTPEWPHGFADEFQSEGQEKEWHEWQKPLPDIRRLVEWFSNPGDLVVDPTGGSFTTAIACLELGRRFVGCDILSESVRIGQERLRRALERTQATADEVR